MEKFFNWYNSNRKYIGTTVGCLDIILGISYIMQNNTVLATMWTAIGIAILFDSWENYND